VTIQALMLGQSTKVVVATVGWTDKLPLVSAQLMSQQQFQSAPSLHTGDPVAPSPDSHAAVHAHCTNNVHHVLNNVLAARCQLPPGSRTHSKSPGSVPGQSLLAAKLASAHSCACCCCACQLACRLARRCYHVSSHIAAWCCGCANTAVASTQWSTAASSATAVPLHST
jgi:hypothetical protein